MSNRRLYLATTDTMYVLDNFLVIPAMLERHITRSRLTGVFKYEWIDKGSIMVYIGAYDTPNRVLLQKCSAFLIENKVYLTWYSINTLLTGQCIEEIV